ncbi:MAG: F-actin-capping protein subunit beta, partial [Watsoniomyces obsoletus]
MLGSNGIQKTTINRIWILALLALPVINLLLSGVVEHALPGTPQTKSRSPIHPIATLVDQANSRFAKMLSDQSKTLEDAVTEYKRRYGRRPPLWFDKWFAIAQEKEFLLIDEFDTIME